MNHSIVLKSFGLAGLASVIALSHAPSALASTITYSLTANDQSGTMCTTGCPGAPYGTVAVSTVQTNEVLVSLSLNPGEVFSLPGGNGAGMPLLFDLSGNPTVTVSNLSTLTPGVSGKPVGTLALHQSSSGIMADGTGSWNYDISCTTCGTGTSGQYTGVISFDLTATGLTPASFAKNTKGLFFGTDIGIPNGSGGYTTGDVAATAGTPVPLPAAAWLLCSAVGGLGAFARRKRHA
jgi:hypothetical protein